MVNKTSFSFLFIFFTSIFFFNFIVAKIDFPDYGSWTGIRPLEKKLKLYEDFASKGDVDAIIIGSSIPDNGFSAQKLSELLTNYYGKPYRVFNFSTGGAEIQTYIKLIRLAMLYGKPKTVFLTIALGPASIDELKIDKREFHPLTPDYILKNSVVGDYLENQYLLKISETVFQKTALSKASAIRDKIVFRTYKSRVPGYVDVTYMSKFGDLIQAKVLSQDLASFDDSHRKFVKRYESRLNEYPLIPDEKKIQSILYPVYIKLLYELCDFAKRENINIVFIPVDASAGYVFQSEKYKEYNRQRFGFLSKFFNTEMIYVLDDLNYDLIHISDSVHGNVHAANIFSERVFEKITNSKIHQSEVYAPRIRDLTSDLLVGSWKIAVLKPSGFKKGRLQCEFLEGWQVPSYSKDLIFELISPENSVRRYPANSLSKTQYYVQIDFSDKVNRSEYFMFRVFEAVHQELPASIPISSCEWVNEY